ncbi:hypothetical protein AVEN_4130-1 [Araneus ventricosus]|uniref:Uncharacterized protein n=1 Tax=Araneus ventricosus TaxID=182803 RepID=A0A4Y2LCA3_ARAVE|nr:hypothetical protein AVEN_4130-1 [Araneus ventricosus]
MACFVFCVDFVTGPEPMEVDDVICDEEMEWEPADTIEPMEWEEAFLPPQVGPSLPLESGTPGPAKVTASKQKEPDNVRRKKSFTQALISNYGCVTESRVLNFAPL